MTQAVDGLIPAQQARAPSKRLLVYISGHGYGHVAQVAPVLNQLGQRQPQLQLVICSAVSETFLRSRIHVDFSYQPRSADFGMHMQSALKVEVAASVAAYIDFHADWQHKIDAEATWLQQQQATAVFSNVAYLPLAAAQQLGLPSLAMCSLNWADILDYYAPGHAELIAVQQQIRQAYAASLFVRPTPAMPMPGLTTVEVGPIADPLPSARSTLLQALRLPADSRLVLVGMGGIATKIAVEDFPRLPGVHWLLPREWLLHIPKPKPKHEQDQNPQSALAQAENPANSASSLNLQRDDFHAQQDLDMSFSSLMASCDVVLTKPGYGTFVEAACLGLPVLYVPRDGWPEQEPLIAWMQAHGHCMAVSEAQLRAGGFATELQQLLATPRAAAVMPVGNQQTAALLAQHLGL